MQKVWTKIFHATLRYFQLQQMKKKKLLELLKLKPIRSVSGVYIITVMPKPFPCPKNEPCIYCPGGPNFGTPQSYTGNEPAGRRAVEHNYDAYNQVKSRIKQFQIMGHDVDKVELIILVEQLLRIQRIILNVL